MVKNLFKDQRPERGSSRILSIFTPPLSREIERLPNNPRVISALAEVDDMIDLAEQALKAIEGHAKILVVPIDEDDTEVRAAHLRTGGDGKAITFAQFQHAVNEMKNSRADYAFNNKLKGWGFGDGKKTARSAMERALADFAGQPSTGDAGSLQEELAGMGIGMLLMFGLNELLGMNHSQDHATLAAGKLPSGTETPSVVSSILRAIVMMKFLHGMTEEAVEQYTKMGNVKVEGLDLRQQIRNAFDSGPPKSRSFDLMRASLASSDREIIARHSVSYAASHIGDGFETWYAYLTTREIHEKGLRESSSAELYRKGYLRGSDKRAEGITKLAAVGISGLAKMQGVLSLGLSPGDACCLTRFLVSVDVDFLEAIRTIIAMSIALLESLAAASMAATLDLMMTPWSIVRSEVIRLIDGVIDRVVDKILDVMDADDEVWDIIKACTPASELMQAVVDQIQWIKRWYKEMLSLLGEELEGWLTVSAEGWESIYGVKKAKEQLLILDRIIQEKQAMLDAELPENQIFGIIEDIRGYRKTYDIPITVVKQIERDVKILVSSELREADRDRIVESISRKLAAAGLPDDKRLHVVRELQAIAQQRNDTKLNELLGYVEEAVGKDTLAGGIVDGANDVTREAMEWCRNLGDWDRLKGVFGAKTNEPTGDSGNI